MPRRFQPNTVQPRSKDANNELQEHRDIVAGGGCGGADVRHGLHARISKTPVQRQHFRQAECRLLSGYDMYEVLAPQAAPRGRCNCPYAEIQCNHRWGQYAFNANPAAGSYATFFPPTAGAKTLGRPVHTFR